MNKIYVSITIIINGKSHKFERDWGKNGRSRREGENNVIIL